MGIRRVAIVGNREDYDDHEVGYTAIHARELWDEARFLPTLEEAVTGAQLVAGTTRRLGTKRNQRRFGPEDFGAFLAQRPEGRVAVVFGNEESGLSTEELALCNVVVSIPTSPDFPSLNLSHAVQIVAYALYTQIESRDIGHIPIPTEDADELSEAVVTCLQELGYFRHHDPEVTRRLFRDIWLRAGLSVAEYRKVHSIFEKLPYIAGKTFAR
jgi:TrmH family RNA methyltransferase